MIRTFFFCLLGCLLAISPMVVASQDEATIRVMTYNIRYNNPDDGVNAWPNRKDHVAEVIGKRFQSDLVGLQEALMGQIRDLEERLPDYAWHGVGRSDGDEEGEHSPIFYRTERFEVLDHGTFWLSENPDEPGSQSWDAAFPRIVTWGKFKDKKLDKVLYHFNTHFDHRGQKAREESAKLLVKKVHEISGNSPSVITGDFNFRESSDPYALLTGKEAINGLRSDLKDARYALVEGKEHEGPTATFTIKNWTEHGAPETKIDYILVCGPVKVLRHRVIDYKYDDERFPSDHLPVQAWVELEE